MEQYDIERALITGKWDSRADSSQSKVSPIAQAVVKGKFREALTSADAKSLLTSTSDRASKLSESTIATWFSPLPTGETGADVELLRLSIGVACLHAFIQMNWTGPDLNVKVAEVIATDLSEEDLNAKAIAELAYGGEPAYHLAKGAVFLRIAQILFDLHYEVCKTVPWWRLRANTTHQRILDEPVPLPPEIVSSVEPLYKGFASEDDLAGRLALEQGLLQHHFGSDKAAADLFIRAARYTGLEYELTGALGKRTKFQQTELTQLVLLAESRARANDDAEERSETAARTAEYDNGNSPSQQPTENQTSSSNVMPETLALNDDTLLEQTEFTSSSAGSKSGSRLSHLDPSSQPALHPLDQCILLSLCLNVKNTSPAHGLTNEQMSPYVERVISHPRNWSVHTIALLLRSRLESTRTRTVERSTLQLQALVDQMPTADSALSERLMYFHSLPLPSKWELEKELALRFFSLGVVRSAMEIFERLEMWEQVVKCWQSMERPDKGISIVRDLLGGTKAEADTVISRGKSSTSHRRQALDSAREAKLWCLLGDLEPDNALAHYTHAWEISRGTSGRAMRSLGGYHFAHEDYTKAIGCFQKAVAINPLMERTWFILGCACVREERWEEAREAFTRCVSIDDEDGESWNNLASVYLRMGAAGVEVKMTEGADVSYLARICHAQSVP
jgi:tetratricopeptide (TPR) repeat protein